MKSAKIVVAWSLGLGTGAPTWSGPFCFTYPSFIDVSQLFWLVAIASS
jgi:hypothetical protein